MSWRRATRRRARPPAERRPVRWIRSRSRRVRCDIATARGRRSTSGSRRRASARRNGPRRSSGSPQLGYVDDDRFAADRAAALAGRGQGDAAIRFDLQGRGVDSEAVEAALAALVPEAERAVELADRLGRTAKTMAQLRRKGFGAEALDAAFGSGIAGTRPLSCRVVDIQIIFACTTHIPLLI